MVTVRALAPLSASTALIVFNSMFWPNKDSVLALAVVFAREVMTRGPEPEADRVEVAEICRRSVVSPAPTYTREPPPRMTLPPLAAPRLVAAEPAVLRPMLVTTTDPPEIVVLPE